MLRKYRVVVSLVVIIAALLGAYRLIWIPYRQSRSSIQTEPLIPDLSSVVPSPTGPTAAAHSDEPPASRAPVPDGRHTYYLGISDNGLVTIYRWTDGNLVVVQELSQLPASQLRKEDRDELTTLVGADTEEEIWQKVEGLTH